MKKIGRRYSEIMSNKKKGFTLIELVVAIAIMAVLALILVPNLTAYIKKADIAKIQANMKNIHTAAEIVDKNEGNLTAEQVKLYSNAEKIEILDDFMEDTYTVYKDEYTGQITIRYRSDKLGDHIFPNIDHNEDVIEGDHNEDVIEGDHNEDLISQGYIPIATADDLNNVRNDLDGKYIQVADIDLSGITNFEPIGRMGNTFKGIFDGGGYVISNLTVNRGGSDNVGLFGRASGATFKNVGLENVNVTGGDNTGGLVGRQGNSSVSNSYATGSVKGGNYTGGLVGYQRDSSIVTNSYATGSVTSTGHSAGGIVGWQSSSSKVANSYAMGSVTGEEDTGGLVGYQNSSSVSDSYYDRNTTGQSDTGKGVGKLTTEMKNKDTYMGWDFTTIWEITNGQYPTLR